MNKLFFLVLKNNFVYLHKMAMVLEQAKKNYALVIIVLGLFFCACKNEISEVQKMIDSHSFPIKTTYKAEYFYTDSGKVQNKLFSNKLERFAGDTNYTKLTGGFVLDFYDSKQKVEATLTARNGLIIDSKNYMEAFDSVVFINTRGEKLFTEQLIWMQDSDLVFTDKPVTITSEDGVLYGKGLRSNQNFTKYKILNTTGTANVEKEKIKGDEKDK
jgi:LPS export ABC transporter protein LptC